VKRIWVLGFLLAFGVGNAFADCEYQGKWYPTGTRIGSKVCQPDGNWR
jgi:hypothetical protein